MLMGGSREAMIAALPDVKESLAFKIEEQSLECPALQDNPIF